MFKQITECDAITLLKNAGIEDHENTLKRDLTELTQYSFPVDYDSQHLLTYQQRISNANDRYNQEILAIDTDIAEISEDYSTNDHVYSPEQEQKDRTAIEQQVKGFLENSLAIAEINKNDLINYAWAALLEWKDSDQSGPLMSAVEVSHSASTYPSASTYHQFVKTKFEPAENFTLISGIVGITLVGITAVLWRRRAANIIRLELELRERQKRNHLTSTILLLTQIIEQLSEDVTVLKARLESENSRVTPTKNSETRKGRMLKHIRTIIETKETILALHRAQKEALEKRGCKTEQIKDLEREISRLRRTQQTLEMNIKGISGDTIAMQEKSNRNERQKYRLRKIKQRREKRKFRLRETKT